MDGLIQNATVEYEGEIFTYQDVCAKSDGYCFENNVLNLDYVMDDVSSDLMILAMAILIKCELKTITNHFMCCAFTD